MDVLSSFQHLPRPRISTITLISSILDPNNENIRAVPPETWHPFLAVRENILNPLELIELAVFLFVLGLRTEGSQTAELMARGFQTVHDSVDLNFWDARFVDRIAPAILSRQDGRIRSKLHSIRQDDIRNALVSAWAHNGWTIRQLLDCIQNEETLRKVLASNEASFHSRKLRQGIRQLLLVDVALEAWQFEVLHHWVQNRRRWWE